MQLVGAAGLVDQATQPVALTDRVGREIEHDRNALRQELQHQGPDRLLQPGRATGVVLQGHQGIAEEHGEKGVPPPGGPRRRPPPAAPRASICRTRLAADQMQDRCRHESEPRSLLPESDPVRLKALQMESGTTVFAGGTAAMDATLFGRGTGGERRMDGAHISAEMKDGIGWIRVAGPLTPSQMNRTIDDFIGAHLPRLVLWDLRAAHLHEITPDSLVSARDVAQRYFKARGPDPKTALLVGEEQHAILARLAIALLGQLETPPDIEQEVFLNLDDALAWLRRD